MEKQLKRIFVLAGRARQGKDTICEFIKDYYKNYKCLYLPNNYYMRDYAKRITGWSGSDADKPRDLLIELADLGRSKDEHFYINRTIEDIEIFSYYFDIIIISDARFPYEISMLEEKYDNVTSIMVKRPNYDSSLSEEQKNHKIETSLNDFDGCDFELINDGTLEDLKDKTYRLLNEVGGLK